MRLSAQPRKPDYRKIRRVDTMRPVLVAPHRERSGASTLGVGFFSRNPCGLSEMRSSLRVGSTDITTVLAYLN